MTHPFQSTVGDIGRTGVGEEPRLSSGHRDVQTFITAAITVPGIVVSRVVTDGEVTIVAGGANATGVVMASSAIAQATTLAPDSYPAGSEANVMRSGFLGVNAPGDVAPDTPVYYTIATGVLSATPPAESNPTTAVLAGASYETTGVRNDVVTIRLNT